MTNITSTIQADAGDALQATVDAVAGIRSNLERIAPIGGDRLTEELEELQNVATGASALGVVSSAPVMGTTKTNILTDLEGIPETQPNAIVINEKDTNFSNAPDFSDTAPDVPDPGLTLADIGAPSAAETDDVTMPTAVDEASPLTLSRINNIVIPTPPAIDFSNYTETIPAFDVVVPDLAFNYSENAYTSPLLTALEARLLDDVTNGGSGLGETVEQAIYDRGSERLIRQLNDDVIAFKAQLTATGFELPTGVMAQGVSNLISKRGDDLADVNRDILIKEAELADSNTKFAIQQSVGLIGTLLDTVNRQAERELRASQSSAEYAVSFLNLKIAHFNANMSRYAQGAATHFQNIQAQAIRLEEHRSHLANANLQLEENKALVAEFTAELQKYNMDIGRYQALVAAANSEVNIQQLKLEQSKVEVSSYLAQLENQKNKIAEHNARLSLSEIELKKFASTIAAQQIKNDIVKVDNEAEQLKLSAKIAREDQLLKAKEQELQLYGVSVDTSLRKANLRLDEFKVDVDRYATKSSVEGEKVKLEQEQVRMKLQRAIEDMNRVFKVAEIKTDHQRIDWDFQKGVTQSLIAAKQFLLEVGARSNNETLTSA
jgi:hypothetical protein